MFVETPPLFVDTRHIDSDLESLVTRTTLQISGFDSERQRGNQPS